MEAKFTNQKIKCIRPMTKEEYEFEGWDGSTHAQVIELTNGILIYASKDGEGNAPGVLFGRNSKGKAQQGFYIL